MLPNLWQQFSEKTNMGEMVRCPKLFDLIVYVLISCDFDVNKVACTDANLCYVLYKGASVRPSL